MKSRQSKLKVLLDTSFILPTLGIDTGEETLKALKKLAEVKASIYYSTFTVLESLWIAARFLQNNEFNLERFRRGLQSITEGRTYAEVKENSDIFSDALKLYIEKWMRSPL